MAQEPLKVAGSFVTPPLDFTRGRKQVGMEVDWLREIAKKLDRDLEFVYAPQNGLDEWIASNQCDILIGELSSLQNVEAVMMSQPFLESSVSILVDQRLRPALCCLEDLKTATVGVLEHSLEADSIQKMYQEGKIGKVVVYPLERTLDALADLTTAQIDAFARLSAVAAYLKYAAFNLKVICSLPVVQHGLCFAIPSQEPSLVHQVNQAQCALMQEGIYQKIMTKWFASEEFNIELAKDQSNKVDQ
ncbi:MAG: amino acid ABC transporter substrate-binding protein [Verrucomicrobia bacterium]|nr:amino acid ABC transporter substrate-binding protein [Verrucomicrobiota bacterium]